MFLYDMAILTRSINLFLLFDKVCSYTTWRFPAKAALKLFKTERFGFEIRVADHLQSLPSLTPIDL